MSCLKYGLSVAVSVFLVCTVALENPFTELSQKILHAYNDPENANGEDLVDAAKDYVCELAKLRMELVRNITGSADLMMEVYLEGNPPFIVRNVPWDKFIKHFKWSDTQITEYEDLISDTRRIWRDCLEELEKFKDPDVIL